MDLQLLIDALRVQSCTESTALPPGVKLVPNESIADGPRRQRGEVRIQSLDSLYEYVRTFANLIDHVPAIFASRAPAVRIRACLDWGYGWGEHSATFELEYTPEWIAWNRISGQKIGQVAFAEFIEEHLDCIHSPSAAEVLTVATTLSGKRKVEFTNCVTLANGDRSLQWNESTEAKAAGDIRVPSEITLRIPIYKGCEAATTFEIRALFRYRIEDGRLAYEVKLLHADKVAGLAFDQIVDSMRNEFSKDEREPTIIVGDIVHTPRAVFNSTIIKN